MSVAGPTTLVKPKTQKGKRALEKRAPKLVENTKRALLLYGNKTSQVVKDVLTDLHKLKGTDCQKYTRKNSDVRPFESGGEVHLEGWCRKSDCSLFALGCHSKKRAHNIVLGRLFDGHMYDMIELGVDRYRSIQHFKSAADSQVGNKPCWVFVGERFESDPLMRQAKSTLLDFFRGQETTTINLAGLDHVMFVSHGEGNELHVRQYRIKLKKSGTKIPRVSLAEMGPSLDVSIRRHKEPPVDLEKEATKKPEALKQKKVKNVGGDLLDGKVGRIYMPQQDVSSIALRKMKGLKRERREAAAADKAEGKPAKRVHSEEQNDE